MTKELPMPIAEMACPAQVGGSLSSFELRPYFVIRDSSFVILRSTSKHPSNSSTHVET
jgi:hypothetical protein